MANWIEYHIALREHYKVDRLAKALGVKYTEALGTISCLWLWSAQNKRDGDLEKFTDAEIAYGARWDGDPKKLVQSLQDAELMDKRRIHDWNDHGLRLLNNARDRMKDYREAKKKVKPSRWRALLKWLDATGSIILGISHPEVFATQLAAEFNAEGEAWTLKCLKALAEWVAKYPQQAKAIGHPEAYALAALKKMRGNPDGVRKIQEIIAQMAQAKSA